VADEIPIGGQYGKYQAMDIPVLSAYGFVDPRIDVINGKVVYVPVQDKYKDYLAYLKKLYAEGLLDKEYFIQTDDQFRAKGSKALYGFFCYSADWVLMATPNLYEQYWGMGPMVSDANSTRQWPARDVAFSGGVSIVKSAKKQEALMRLFDYFWTETGRIMVRAGPEAGTWGSDGGWKWSTNDKGDKCFEFVVPPQFTSFNDFREKIILPMAIPYADDGTFASYMISKDARQVRLTREVVENLAPYYRTGFPVTYFTKAENERINLIQTDLETYVQEMDAKFIIGDQSLDSNWDAFVKKVQGMGLAEMLKIRQDAYDRWNR
jgi:putative aldouronate transport system substrate-binding protein